MDIFNYLEEDNASIAQRLVETAKNYSQWSRDRIFEEVKKEFASAKEHFSKEALLENNLKNAAAVQSILSEVSQRRNEIMNEIEQIVEIHVDEPGFEQSLETIANKYSQYARYCKEKFYPAMKKILSTDELKHINEQLEQKALS